MGKKTTAAKEAARSNRRRKRKAEAKAMEMLASLNDRKPPEILNTALAAMEGNPLPNDPWNFNSVLENQAGNPQAERFISIIRRTRRSKIVEDNDGVRAVWDLAGMPWVRPLGAWKSKGKKAETKFRSLAAHLTCKYPMPQFLFSAFWLRVGANRRDPGGGANNFNPRRNRAQMLQLFEYLAGGGSVRKAVREGMLPVPFTKRMCHEFMNSPKTVDVFEAIRYAQVRAEGGDERLARELASTRMGRGTFAPEAEPRVMEVIGWYCRQGMLNPDLVGPLYDYIEHRMRGDIEFTMAGRTVGALERGMHEWHEQLNARRRRRDAAAGGGWWNRKPPAKFDPCGLEEMMVEVGEKPHQNIWTVEEILTMSGLRSEGAAMRHCVSSYWHRIESGNTSIWTLQKNGNRELTVEVDNTMGAVVQARGVCNHRPSVEQSNMLHRWASLNKLLVRST